jgi:hypothetical protein
MVASLQLYEIHSGSCLQYLNTTKPNFERKLKNTCYPKLINDKCLKVLKLAGIYIVSLTLTQFGSMWIKVQD